MLRLLLLIVLLAGATPALAQQRTQYVFAASWQPGFCETAPSRPECESQVAGRYDADHFALHGLWPQRMDYCGVSGPIQIMDGDRKWDELPAPRLEPATRETLDTLMPGAQSFLDRHEWVRHGSCYGTPAEEYFADSIAVLDALNASAVRDLFVANLGQRLTLDQVRSAFDQSFGAGAGERIRLACERDGDRRIISEITIGLTGDITVPADVAQLMLAARPTDGGCNSGIVDPVGLQ